MVVSLAVQLDFKLQHFPVRQLPGPDRSGNFPDRIWLKHCSYCEYYYYEWKLGVDAKSGFIFLFCSKIAWGQTFGSPLQGRPCCPLYHLPKPQIHCAGGGGDVDLSDKTKKPVWFSSKVDYCKFKCVSYASMDDNVNLIRKWGSKNHVRVRSHRAKRAQNIPVKLID